MNQKQRDMRVEFAKGHTVEECAKEWGISWTAAYRFIRFYGRKINRVCDRNARVRLAYAETHSFAECAVKWGIKEANARDWCRKHGLRKNKPKKPAPVVKPVFQPRNKYEAMELIPIYPEGKSKREVGLVGDIPHDAMLCEEARLLSWVSKSDKDKWLARHINEKCPR